MDASDWIRAYDGALKESTCATWRDELEASEYTRRIDQEYLRCSKLTLDNVMWSSTREQLVAAFERYKSDVPHNGNLHFCTHIEVPSILKYGTEGTDHFHLHADNWNAESALRQVSAIVSLNTVEEGGATVFPEMGESFRPVMGRALFFPAFFLYLHRAEPPISSSKYALITWFCYPRPVGTHYAVVPAKP